MPKVGDKKTSTTPDGKMQWTQVYTASGWSDPSQAYPTGHPELAAKPASSTPKPKPKTKATPDAARAVAGAMRNIGERTSAALGLGGSSPLRTPNTPAPPSSNGGESPQSSPSPAPKPAAKPKPPGAVYRATRSAYKEEQANAPKRYETPEQMQQRQASSKFDWSMSGEDVKSARSDFLKSHPAAAKAVAKGTLSMGDINLTVRRLKKKNAAAAPPADSPVE